MKFFKGFIVLCVLFCCTYMVAAHSNDTIDDNDAPGSREEQPNALNEENFFEEINGIYKQEMWDASSILDVFDIAKKYMTNYGINTKENIFFVIDVDKVLLDTYCGFVPLHCFSKITPQMFEKTQWHITNNGFLPGIYISQIRGRLYAKEFIQTLSKLDIPFVISSAASLRSNDPNTTSENDARMTAQKLQTIGVNHYVTNEESEIESIYECKFFNNDPYNFEGFRYGKSMSIRMREDTWENRPYGYYCKAYTVFDHFKDDQPPKIVFFIDDQKDYHEWFFEDLNLFFNENDNPELVDSNFILVSIILKSPTYQPSMTKEEVITAINNFSQLFVD